MIWFVTRFAAWKTDDHRHPRHRARIRVSGGVDTEMAGVVNW